MNKISTNGTKWRQICRVVILYIMSQTSEDRDQFIFIDNNQIAFVIQILFKDFINKISLINNSVIKGTNKQDT